MVEMEREIDEFYGMSVTLIARIPI